MSSQKRIDDIIKRDKKIFLTTTRSPYNFVADRGDGDYAYDITGKRFIDFTSFISTYNLGVNGNAEIRRAIKMQVDKLTHSAFTDYYSELPVLFGESLIKMFPKGFGRMFLSNSGTEANEAAVKFAKIFSKRQYVISFYNSFHGRSAGSLGLTASKSVQRAHFGPFNGVIHAPYPYPYRCPFNHGMYSCGEDSIEYIRNYILKKEVKPEEVAAIVFEPIQGEGGYIVPPKEFFKGLKELSTENGILLIDDEVQSGYMRTGKFLALDNFGITADIYTMAKALGGGLPLGATVTRGSLGDIPQGAHASTFGGNHASVAAAYASLKYVTRNKRKLEIEVRRKSGIAFKRLREMQEKYDMIGDVRGLGLMIGIELVRDRKTKEHAIREREKIIKSAFNKGLLLLTCGDSTIRIIPPITISETSLMDGLDILEKSIKDVS
ncbi:MAG: aminotransferase class III-fold pyridoxal phosphate-dependent enzyme [Candidatus Micrarchaeota archaeon]|nr:aminotransferase class III-fold pyridoxal phosphate-dependent enzyme [Candidatus Micrarchaeota archaeon]